MKKFLWLAVILTVFNGDANAVSPFATCSLHTASKCATSRGFIAEGKQGCAGPETKCRRTFCEAVCTKSDVRSDTATMRLCVGNCTGITFTDGVQLHEALQQSLGRAASTDRSVGLSARETSLAQTLPPALVKAFQAAALEEQNRLFKANQSKEEVKKLGEQLKAVTSNQSTLQRLIRTWLKQAAISAGTYNPNAKGSSFDIDNEEDDDEYDAQDEEDQSQRRSRRRNSRRFAPRY